MSHSVLLDSNIVIGLSNGTISVDVAYPADTIFISAITVTELFALAGMSEAEEDMTNKFIETITVAPLTTAIARQAGILLRTRSRRHRADMLIAATALEYGIVLLTQNQRDFKNIPKLRLQSLA